MAFQITDAGGAALTELHQWDAGVGIAVSGIGGEGDVEFHFANRLTDRALVVIPEADDGTYTAKIPNELLTHAEAVFLYVCRADEDGIRTVHSVRIPVIGRKKPDDYVFTDDAEYVSWSDVLTEAQSLFMALEGATFEVSGGSLIFSVPGREPVTVATVSELVGIDVPTSLSELVNDAGFLTRNTDDLANYYKKSETYSKGEADSLVSAESVRSTAKENALQSQIDAIVAASDVVDVVGDLTVLDIYDTSALSDKDIVKVLSDSNHDGSRAYYRWEFLSPEVGGWNYIGSESPTYTKAETDTLISSVRSGAAAGATAYQKPSGGIPKTDLASAVQTSLDSVSGKEAKGKITAGGTEYSVTRKALTITEGGVTSTFYVADIT